MSYQNALLDWYHEHKRDLPWRRTSDPYAIWLSEIMAQQTQVSTVIPYYEKFLTHYPTVFDLANASEDEVYKLWEGLGYYSRASRLRQCAKVVASQYEGHFPPTIEGLLKLPGIGPYTAGAIGSIAFGIKEPAIDGNVMRVFSRLYALDFDIGKANARKLFDPYVRKDLPTDISGFNQGLMELGATICTPTKPKCQQCPIMNQCKAYNTSQTHMFPVKLKKKKKIHQQVVVVEIRHEDKIMLEKRGPTGLLANLWCMPIVLIEGGLDPLVTVKDYVDEQYGLKITLGPTLITGKHVFTHIVWDMTMMAGTAHEIHRIDDPVVAWVEPEAVRTYPLPAALTKLMDRRTQ